MSENKRTLDEIDLEYETLLKRMDFNINLKLKRRDMYRYSHEMENSKQYYTRLELLKEMGTDELMLQLELESDVLHTNYALVEEEWKSVTPRLTQILLLLTLTISIGIILFLTTFYLTNKDSLAERVTAVSSVFAVLFAILSFVLWNRLIIQKNKLKALTHRMTEIRETRAQILKALDSAKL